MDNWKFKMRTILIVLLVLLLCYGTYKLSKTIKNAILERNMYYSDLMRVTDEESLQYAIDNKLEEFLISGTVTSNENISFPELNQSFAGVKRRKYHYESHIKTETYTDSDGDSHTRTKTVWDWESKGSEEKKTSTVTLLGHNFSINNVPYYYHSSRYNDIGGDFSNGKSGNYYYIDNDTRYSYDIIPKSWNVTMTCNYNLEKIKDFGNQSIEQVISPWSTTWVTVVMIIFIVGFLVGGALIWIYWENIFYKFLVD